MSEFRGPIRRVETKRGHHYLDADDRRVPGVTTIKSGGIPDGRGLKHWRGTVTAGWAVDHWDELSQLPISERIEKIGKAQYKVRDRAANRGREVHELAERLIAGESVEVPEAIEDHVESFVHFLDEWEPEVLHRELSVYSLKYGYAGTLDAILFIPSLAQTLVVDYKGLAVDTPIPIPTGWSTMGALAVGDEVFDSSGAVCRVTHKSEVKQRDCYRLVFDDGSSVVCDDEHRWPVQSGRAPHTKPGVLAAPEIRATLRLYGQRQHRIEMAGPLDLPTADLLVDPYVLGAWLGDGATSAAVITKPDNELFDLIGQRGYVIGKDISAADRCQTRTIHGLRGQLRELNLLGHKAVPDAYLRGSIEQRVDLLRGLMDTDGSYNRARGRVVFVSTDKALSTAVCELALSLGERASVRQVQGFGFGRSVTHWNVEWRPQRFVPFALTRKADLVTLAPSTTSRRRLVMSAEPTITVPTQCIAVDSPDHTYLCGEQMIPTHNTNNSGIFGDIAVQLAPYRYAESFLDSDNVSHPMIPVDGCAAVHIRPDGYDLIPVEAGPEQFEAFLHAAAVKRFVDTSRDLVADPLTPPTACNRRRLIGDRTEEIAS